MRLLVLTSTYGVPGYGLHCQEVCEILAASGHSLEVLTCPEADRHIGIPAINVVDTLARDPDWNLRRPGYLQCFLDHPRREKHSLQIFAQRFAAFEPDLIFVWQGTGLSRRLLQYATATGRPVVYRLADYWPTVADEYLAYWDKPAPRSLNNLAKRLLAPIGRWWLARRGRPLAINFDRSICVSHTLCTLIRAQGVPLRDAVTVFNGVDLDRFWIDPQTVVARHQADTQIRLVYGGRLMTEKGPHVAVAAMQWVRQAAPTVDIQLHMYGTGPRDYVAMLEEQIIRLGLQDTVHLAGRVPREQIPAILAEHTALVFPTLYEEPLASMIQEAMAAGTVVVGTDTGGTKEILQHEVNGLVVPPGDAAALAEQILRLQDVALRLRLVQAAQATVRARCDIRQNVKQIETYLQTCIETHND